MKKFVALLICVTLLCCFTSAGMSAEYIEPTFNENTGGPTIGTTVKKPLNIDGKYYRDSNGNGTLDTFENWELDVNTRVKALLDDMSIDEKIGLLIIGDRGTGLSIADAADTSMGGLLDEYTGYRRSDFGTSYVYGTTIAIQDMYLRRFIFRENIQPDQIAKWNNALQQLAESTDHGIPVVIASNSRNENGEASFGMNDASGVFSTWPGTLGLAAAALGDIKAGGDAQLITDFANISRTEWEATGIKKGYMYMADVATDPRWQRTYGTLGERPDFISNAITRLIKGFQGGDELQTNGVAMTTKHFPGGGARENGFDPHYSLGQWNVYATENSLAKYHLPPFEAAIASNTSSIMPYYARPAEYKSASQVYNSEAIDLGEDVGFAYNKYFIKTLLRSTMGFEGYINSDTGILGNMAWGMTMYSRDQAIQAAYAINAGTDIISGLMDATAIKEAYLRSTSADFLAKDSNPSHVLTEERINEAAGRLLKEEFLLGLFENPYRDPDDAVTAVNTARSNPLVAQAHRKSVVLLKNSDSTLPLTADKYAGKKVYVEYFNKSGEVEETLAGIKKIFSDLGITLTEDYNEADYAILFIDPSSGNYFSATDGYLEIDICENKTVAYVDRTTGLPTDETAQETTLKDADKIAKIASAVHANGGSVISNVNIKMPWLMKNVEPISEALLVSFATSTEAIADVITGVYNPTGVLPLTLPRSEEVIAVNKDGICASRNDVPGYDKDVYLAIDAPALIDENGKGYAYKDTEGSYYVSLFGLSFDVSSGNDKPTPEDPTRPTVGSQGGGCNTGLTLAGLFAVIGLFAGIKKMR